MEIRVPTLGESVTEATIAQWFKSEGDAVAMDEPIVELETDKVTVEVSAPSAGTLSEILVKDAALTPGSSSVIFAACQKKGCRKDCRQDKPASGVCFQGG